MHLEEIKKEIETVIPEDCFQNNPDDKFAFWLFFVSNSTFLAAPDLRPEKEEDNMIHQIC